ncbi:unnamed protein product [Prunus armeniaca]
MKNYLINNKKKNKLQKTHNKKIHPNQMPLWRSDRTRRSTAILDYVYLQEADFDISDEVDPTSFKKVMKSQNADKWREVMLNGLKSMKNNQV